jgi:hypothetical protein
MGLIPLGILSSSGAQGPPAFLSSARLWLDAADASTITHLAGSVSQWNNKGVLGNFTQGTGALQPTTNATTINNLNVIDFNSDFLTATNTNEWKFLHDGTVYFYAAVIKIGNSSNPNAFLTLWGTNGGTTSLTGGIFGYDDRTGIANNALNTFFSNGSGDAAQSSIGILASDLLTPNVNQIVTALISPANATINNRLQLFINAGSAASLTNARSGTPSSGNPSRALQIGNSGNSDAPFVGSLGEMIFVSGADATELNRQLVRNYLNQKWAIYS